MINLCEFSRISSSTGDKVVNVASKNKTVQALQEAVEKVVTIPHTSADIAAKASSNYAVGGIVMRDAKKVVSGDCLNSKVIKLMMENPNCSEAELKKLITEVDNNLVKEYDSIRKECRSLKESDFERISQFIKKLDTEIEVLKSNPEHSWELDRIAEARYFNGKFDGYEYNAANMNPRIKEYQNMREHIYRNFLLNLH